MGSRHIFRRNSFRKIAIINCQIVEAPNGLNFQLCAEDTQKLRLVKMETDLFATFRGFLILGRCLGLLPISGIFNHSYQDLKVRFCSIAGLTSVFCIILTSSNLLLAFYDTLLQRKRNASEIAHSIGHPIFGFWGVFLYTYFLLNRQKFIEMFKSWTQFNSTLTYTRQDANLKWTIVIVSVVMLTSTVLENATLHMEYFAEFDDINGHTVKYGEDVHKNVSPLQMYYWRSHLYWSNVLGFHPLLSLVAFLNNKIVLYSGNYVDVMTALFARALYFKFTALNNAAEEILLHVPSLPKRDRNSWNQLAKDHESLCDLLNAMKAFFSPIIFVSYTINIYYLCMQLLNLLNPDFTKDSIVHSIYSPWSFIHIIARIYMLTLCLARINEEAHKTNEIVSHCPVEFYGGLIAKLDRRLNSGQPLGWTGLNCFTVTKPFMLSILNVVFMIEIVLLQGMT